MSEKNKNAKQENVVVDDKKVGTEPIVETAPAEVSAPATENPTETNVDAAAGSAPTEETNGSEALRIGTKIHEAIEKGVPAEEAIRNATYGIKTAICVECHKVVDINRTSPRGDHFICNDCSGKPDKPVAPVVPEENYKVFPIEEQEHATMFAIAKGWKMVSLIKLFGVTENDCVVVYKDSTMMPENLAKFINKIEEVMPDAVKNPSASTPTADGHGKSSKTSGVFEITSNFNPNFSLKGSSSQIEICTRDYMSWCLKDKAPKNMQAEYDRVLKETKESDPKKIFKVTILKATSKPDELKAAKEEFGLSNKGGKPQGTSQTTAGDASKTTNITPDEALKAMPTFEDTHGKTEEAKPEAPEETKTEEK